MQNIQETMNTQEMLKQIQNNLIEVAYDLSKQLNDSKSYDEVDTDIATLGNLSTVIERVGKIIVLDYETEDGDSNDFTKDEQRP